MYRKITAYPGNQKVSPMTTDIIYLGNHKPPQKVSAKSKIHTPNGHLVSQIYGTSFVLNDSDVLTQRKINYVSSIIERTASLETYWVYSVCTLSIARAPRPVK